MSQEEKHHSEKGETAGRLGVADRTGLGEVRGTPQPLLQAVAGCPLAHDKALSPGVDPLYAERGEERAASSMAGLQPHTATGESTPSWPYFQVVVPKGFASQTPWWV